LTVARESGLVREGRPLVVLLSGGADSVCLLDVSLRLGAHTRALHVNYGLREGADQDEAFCRALCERLRVPLSVERAEIAANAGGNLQARARELRYAHAERLAREAGGDYASAHTASDQAETVLYRLAVSPGRRALLGMEPRRGRLVRPLLRATREDTRAYCEARGLEWREDPSNLDRRFARVRVRQELLPTLRSLNPAAERVIAETSLLLRDEAEVLDRATEEAVERLGPGAAVQLADLRAEPLALARLVLRRLAEQAAGRAHPLSRDQADAILALGERGGSQALDLGGGLRAVAEYGTLRFAAAPEVAAAEPVELTVPGTARFGDWEVEAGHSPGEVAVSAAALGSAVTVRSWREGDRMRPAGLGGSKSLQDLFTDRKVPRELRRSLPVVETDGEIVWVAGVAVAEGFRAREGDAGAVWLSARRVGLRGSAGG
jgi:tRNA(Ile)-lysidine synthase